MESNHAEPVTLSKEDMQRVTKERISEISNEFTGGFELLDQFPRSVTFFGSTETKEDNPYYSSARTLATKIVTELGYSITTGGGPGIMEAASRGAFEAGGHALGLTIKLPHPQIVNKYITNEIEFYYFFIRKVCLSFSAEAFIFYPGGFGTLDEFFEIVTLVQTKKIEGVPIICVGSDYWNGIKAVLEKELLSRGTINQEDLDLFMITDDLDEIVELIRAVPMRTDFSTRNSTEVRKAESES
jgi:uncharacterized protein (TIGR00730 family)